MKPYFNTTHTVDLELRAITETSFALFSGDTALKQLVFEVNIELASGLRRMTIVADPRSEFVFNLYFDLVITFGGVVFRRSEDQIRILWSDDEMPCLFRDGVNDLRR